MWFGQRAILRLHRAGKFTGRFARPPRYVDQDGTVAERRPLSRERLGIVAGAGLGIVLSYMRYGDTSIIARIFTEESGYGSYIVNSVRSQKSKKSIGYFQPFTILDMLLYVK